MAVVEYVKGETGHEIEYQSRTTDSPLTETLLDYESEVATADIVVMPSRARIRSDASDGHLEPIGDTWNPENYAVDLPSDAYEVDIVAQLPEMADEVTVVPDLDDALGDPFQGEFWSRLKGLWSTPETDLDSMLSTLDETLQETLEGDEGCG